MNDYKKKTLDFKNYIQFTSVQLQFTKHVLISYKNKS